MGLSLAEAAVCGTKSDQATADEKQSLLAAGDTEGLIRFNRAIFGGATMMAKKDDDADDDQDDDEDDDESDEDDDEDDDGDDDDDDKSKGKKKDPKDERIQELSAEAKKRRLRNRKQAERIAELEAENARLKKGSKGKAKDDDEDDEDEESEETVAVKKENEALKETLRKQTIRTEFTDILAKPKQKIKFKDPKVAFRLLDLDDVEIDEEGDVDGLEDAIKDLAKKAPYLLVDDEKDEDDEDEDEKPKRRTGQRTGGSRSKGKPNEETLRKKYGIKR